VLQNVTADTFRPHQGRLFRVIVDDRWEMQARLTAVEVSMEPSAQGWARVPFTLVFHGPAESSLPQRIYRLEAEGLEPLDVFLVPAGQDGEGMRYEAVFT
jgi:hypothetical protein